MGTQSIPMTGLAPARHAALWAANERTRTGTKSLLVPLRAISWIVSNAPFG